MNDILQGLGQAAGLVVSLDADLIEIAALSLRVSLGATLIASAIGLPLGAWLAISRFRLRRLIIALMNALMGLPPVVVGLVVYVLLSRAGPLGVLGLLFTPTAMIIAQVIIVTPIIASIAHQAIRDLWADYHDLLISLHTSRRQRIMALLWDGRRALMTAALAGFGRAIGEVGAIMIVGGNIDHATRALTTAIALETGKGDFALAIGLGVRADRAGGRDQCRDPHAVAHRKEQPMVSPILPLTLDAVELRRGGRTILGPVTLTLARRGHDHRDRPERQRQDQPSARHARAGTGQPRPADLARVRPTGCALAQAFVFQTPILMRRRHPRQHRLSPAAGRAGPGGGAGTGGRDGGAGRAWRAARSAGTGSFGRRAAEDGAGPRADPRTRGAVSR